MNWHGLLSHTRWRNSPPPERPSISGYFTGFVDSEEQIETSTDAPDLGAPIISLTR